MLLATLASSATCSEAASRFAAPDLSFAVTALAAALAFPAATRTAPINTVTPVSLAITSAPDSLAPSPAASTSTSGAVARTVPNG